MLLHKEFRVSRRNVYIEKEYTLLSTEEQELPEEVVILSTSRAAWLVLPEMILRTSWFKKKKRYLAN